MFRSRTSSAKPGDDLLANFRQQFPEVTGVGGSTTAPVAPAKTAVENIPSAIVATSQDSHRNNQSLSHDVFKDQDPTPRATNEPWRFTPSLLDPNSFSFANFANQPAGYYAPTPGGTNTLYHPQAGDLHTPTLGLGMGMGLNTQLSLPPPEPGIHHQHGGIMDMPNFHSMTSHQFQFNPFLQPTANQPSFGPTTFVQQDTGYEAMEHDVSPIDSDPTDERIVSLDSSLHHPPDRFQTHSQFVPMAETLPASAEKFRFYSTLNAPTAMIKHANEIPVTYLNKGQAYSLSIVDTSPTPTPIVPGTQYRTFVRVSFEDDHQRQKPGVCWSLWKEGRGTSEAHQRGGKLQAVEFVEAGQPPNGDNKRTHIDLETASFDGFSVVWTPALNGDREVNITVRFNFLSTDFSHSKGVKGIPVRLCAKTNLVTSSSSDSHSSDTSPEICYCKVKLFRDHGAERKLSNDVAHVKKTIDKLKQQIAQSESGMKDFGKRKRGAKVNDGQRPGKVQKHKRTWSMSSVSSAGGVRGAPVEDDLQTKLQTLQDMFTSTRTISILYLRGGDLDDPDAHPVALPGEPVDLTKVNRESVVWQVRSGHSSVAGSSGMSHSPSSLSLQSQVSVLGQPWGETSRQGSADQPTKVETHDDTGNLSGWIEALGVDSSYTPPPERIVKPVACFYVAKRSHPGGQREYHRAVYLMQRSAREFTTRIALKWQLDPSKIQRTIRVLPRGLEVEIDDDVVHSLAEAQVMTLDMTEVSTTLSQQKQTIPTTDWEMVVDVDADSSASNAATPANLGYELRLTF